MYSKNYDITTISEQILLLQLIFLRYNENNLLAIYHIEKAKYHEYGRLTDNSTLPVDVLYPICRLNVHKRDGCKEEMLVNTLII